MHLNVFYGGLYGRLLSAKDGLCVLEQIRLKSDLSKIHHPPVNQYCTCTHVSDLAMQREGASLAEP